MNIYYSASIIPTSRITFKWPFQPLKTRVAELLSNQHYWLLYKRFENTMDEQTNGKVLFWILNCLPRGGGVLFQKLSSQKLLNLCTRSTVVCFAMRMLVKHSKVSMWEWVRHELILFVQLDLGCCYELNKVCLIATGEKSLFKWLKRSSGLCKWNYYLRWKEKSRLICPGKVYLVDNFTFFSF